MSLTLLIDGDILAYREASSIEQAVEWEPGYWTWSCNEHEVRAAINAQIERYMDELGATDYKIALTDSGLNFRKKILPTYKGKRAAVKKPLVLLPIREWLIEEHDAILRPTLEGDDVLGILATSTKLVRGDRMVLSIDKDMLGVPCTYLRDLGEEAKEVSVEDADRWHLIQTLAGDVTDGYGGCPGIGMVNAIRIIDDPRRLIPEEYTPKRGKMAGIPQVRWVEGDPCDPWTAVLDRYRAAGLSENEALTQARVAFILRASHYDFVKREPILWNAKTSTT